MEGRKYLLLHRLVHVRDIEGVCGLQQHFLCTRQDERVFERQFLHELLVCERPTREKKWIKWKEKNKRRGESEILEAKKEIFFVYLFNFDVLFGRCCLMCRRRRDGIGNIIRLFRARNHSFLFFHGSQVWIVRSRNSSCDGCGDRRNSRSCCSDRLSRSGSFCSHGRNSGSCADRLIRHRSCCSSRLSDDWRGLRSRININFFHFFDSTFRYRHCCDFCCLLRCFSNEGFNFYLFSKFPDKMTNISIENDDLTLQFIILFALREYWRKFGG